MQQRLDQPGRVISVRHEYRLHSDIVPFLLGCGHHAPIQKTAHVEANNALDEFTLAELLAHAPLYVADRRGALEPQKPADGLSNRTNERIRSEEPGGKPDDPARQWTMMPYGQVMKLGYYKAIGAAALASWMIGTGAMAAEQAGKWTTAEKDGRFEAYYGEALMLGWQAAPLAKPVGGEKFAGSAFLHPLRTPAGFEWTTIQPDDHKHHFGLWWPWKYIEVDGAKYNCWEIQEGQGAHMAGRIGPLMMLPGNSVQWDFLNETVIKKPGAAPQTVTHETAQVAVSVEGDAQVLDISIRQKAAGSPVKILEYRYSGFSWRGPLSWNKDNSTMTTSEGKDRENANGTPARWVVVSGPTPHGSASVLMMSAAANMAGTPELLRVWDSKNQNGMPFVNFNPVTENPLPLDDAHPAVSNRKYRVIAADRLIDAAAAEAEWRKWLGK